MFTILEKTLVQNSCLSRPVVYVDQEVDQNLNSRLADIITKHQVREGGRAARREDRWRAGGGRKIYVILPWVLLFSLLGCYLCWET